MPSSLHRLAAYLLLAMYGVVGLTGDSLHYLMQEALVQEALVPEQPVRQGIQQRIRQGTASQSSTESGKVAVYFHSHGPGGHGHFHCYVRRQTAEPVGHKKSRSDHEGKRQQARSQQTEPAQNRGERSADENLVLDGLPHSPHSCLLLAIVKELELGHACANAVCIGINTRFESPLRIAPATATQLDAQCLARGPPTALV